MQQASSTNHGTLTEPVFQNLTHSIAFSTTFQSDQLRAGQYIYSAWLVYVCTRVTQGVMGRAEAFEFTVFNLMHFVHVISPVTNNPI